MNKTLIIFGGLFFGLLMLPKRAKASSPGNSSSGWFSPPVYPLILRSDAMGDGKFGASRKDRKHQGTDFECRKYQSVFSPIDGVLNRWLQVYANDTKYIGCEVKGTGQYAGFMVKLFYMTPVSKGTTLKAGDYIGQAQAISEKYGAAMKDHIHVEVRKDGNVLDPEDFFKYSV